MGEIVTGILAIIVLILHLPVIIIMTLMLAPAVILTYLLGGLGFLLGIPISIAIAIAGALMGGGNGVEPHGPGTDGAWGE